MVEKSPDAFRTISEVANDLDVPQHVLRFWETRFSQVKPMKRGGGRRYYRPDDVELLRGIRHLLYGDGYTIKGVQRILRENGVRHVIGLGKSLHHDAVNGAGAADTEPAATEASEPAIPSVSESHSAEDRVSDAPMPTVDLSTKADIRVPEPAQSPERARAETDETIDFSASRSVLVRRRQQEADGVEATRAVSFEPEVVPSPVDGGSESGADDMAEPVAPRHAALSPEPVAQEVASTVPDSPEPDAAVPGAAAPSPDQTTPSASAAATGLDEDDVIRLQSAVFELLECRRILSEQD